MNLDQYIKSCPVGCEAEAKDSPIILPEGCLKQCTECGQLFSQCTEVQYNDSMEEFNVSVGTWPRPDTLGSLERSTKKTLKRIEKILKKPLSQLKLLDVGCSNGAFIFVAGKMGVECEGIEPAKEAALSAQKFGLRVHHGYLGDVDLPSESYDIITIFEVIEHVKDPVDLMRKAYNLLSKNGIMVIRTANTNSWTVGILKGLWHYFSIRKHGGHISFFNKKSMAVLAKKTKFDIAVFKTLSVSLCDKERTNYFMYRGLKILSEALNLPTKGTGKGQEMEVFLKK